MRNVVTRINHAVTPAAAFVVEEEEGLILGDRPAGGSAENVVPQRRFVTGEERAGVNLLIAEELIRCSVEIIRSRASGHDDEAAAGPPILGGVIVLLGFELLQGFSGRIQAELSDPESHVLDDGSIQRPHLVTGAATTHRKKRQRLGATLIPIDDIAHQPNQRRAAAARQRHVEYGVAFDELPDGRSFRLQ